MKYTKQLFIDRFIPRVQFTGDCWNWTGAISGGYGNMRWKGRHYQAHVLFYLFFNGKYPKCLQLNHLCENKRCVNPDHLEPVTGSDNQKYSNRFCIEGHDMDLVGRLPNRHGCAECYAARQAVYKQHYRATCQRSQVRVL